MLGGLTNVVRGDGNGKMITWLRAYDEGAIAPKSISPICPSLNIDNKTISQVRDSSEIKPEEAC